MRGFELCVVRSNCFAPVNGIPEGPVIAPHILSYLEAKQSAEAALCPARVQALSPVCPTKDMVVCALYAGSSMSQGTRSRSH